MHARTHGTHDTHARMRARTHARTAQIWNGRPTQGSARPFGCNARIAAFEPIAHNVQNFRQKLAQQSHGKDDVSIRMIALGSRPGNSEIFVETKARNDSKILIGSLGVSGGHERSLGAVPVATLDGWRKDEGLEMQHIHVLKIDCEGKDAEVLQGAFAALQAGRVDYIFWEYSQFWIVVGSEEPPSNLRTTVEFLDSLGYDSYMLGGRNALQLNRLCWNAEYETWTQSDILSISRALPLNQHFLRKYNNDYW